jgi:hypothetical protein
MDPWDVFHVSVGFGPKRLKYHLERRMCHLSEWAMCLLLMFLHEDLLSSMGGGALMVIVACGTNHEIQRLDTLEECLIRE